MKQLIRCLSRVTDPSSQQQRLLSPCSSPKAGRRRSSCGDDDDGDTDGGRRWRVEVPEGHLPVYVGEEMERFVVRADLLSRPVFRELLRRSAEEYGYEQRGVLRIPFPAPLFQRVLDLLLAGADVAATGLLPAAVGQPAAAADELERSFREELAIWSS